MGLSNSAVFWRRRRSRSRKNAASRIGGGGLIIQGAVDAVVVVVESPAVDHPTGLLPTQEQLPVQQLVTQLAVERFDVAVLPWAALGDEQRLHIGTLQPTTNRLGHELWTVVAANVLRHATYREQVLQNADHVLGRERTAHFDRQTLTRVLIDDRQQPQLTAILRAIGQEVVRLDVVLVLSTMTHTAVLAAAKAQTSPAVLFFRHLHVLALPKPMHSFVVNQPIAIDEQLMNPLCAKARTLPGEVSHLS